MIDHMFEFLDSEVMAYVQPLLLDFTKLKWGTLMTIVKAILMCNINDFNKLLLIHLPD